MRISDWSSDVCSSDLKSDMLAKGQDAGNIRLGDTLSDDQFWDRTFDFCMSNPPYGFDWKASKEAVEEEALAQGSRFSHGLPSVGDGQMLFLTHLARPEERRVGKGCVSPGNSGG